VADVASGLADAHERGIVLRDVKPDNVLLAPTDDAAVAKFNRSPDEKTDVSRRSLQAAHYRVKLSDFGLTRHVIETELLQMNQAAVVGTSQYMAPEQCTGAAVDPRADVYALGATL
jgi:serine/threonine-protein kinase